MENCWYKLHYKFKMNLNLKISSNTRCPREPCLGIIFHSLIHQLPIKCYILLDTDWPSGASSMKASTQIHTKRQYRVPMWAITHTIQVTHQRVFEGFLWFVVSVRGPWTLPVPTVINVSPQIHCMKWSSREFYYLSDRKESNERLEHQQWS